MITYIPKILRRRTTTLAYLLILVSSALTSVCEAQPLLENFVLFNWDDRLDDPESDLMNKVISETLAVALQSPEGETAGKMLRLLDHQNGQRFIPQLHQAMLRQSVQARKTDLENALLRITQSDSVLTKQGLLKLNVRDLLLPNITDYAELAAYPNLRKLSLRMNPYMNSQLEHLEKLKHLQTLILPDFLNDEGLALVAEIASLQNLTLGQCSVTDEGLKSLTNLKKLQHLDLSRCGVIQGTGLKHLQQLPELETLILPPRIEGESLAVLADFPSLEYIEFNSNLSLQSMIPLKDSASLKGLRWPRSMMNESYYLQMLAQMDPIRIDVEGFPDPEKYTDNGTPLVSDKSELQIEADIHALQRYSLSDDHKGFSGGAEFRDHDMHRLDSLAKLSRLILSETNVTDEGMWRYRNISNLDSIVLPPKATDGCIWSLHGCRHLQELDMRVSQITDQGLLEVVEHCYSLKKISVPSGVTSQSISVLAKLGLLEQITFQGSDISVAGVEGLEPLKSLSWLGSLQFNDVGFTEAEQKAIRKEFSHVYIWF